MSRNKNAIILSYDIACNTSISRNDNKNVWINASRKNLWTPKSLFLVSFLFVNQFEVDDYSFKLFNVINFFIFIYLFQQCMFEQWQCIVKNVNMIKIHGCLPMLGHIGVTLLPLKARQMRGCKTDKNDQKTKNLKYEPNYIHTDMYNYIQ